MEYGKENQNTKTEAAPRPVETAIRYLIDHNNAAYELILSIKEKLNKIQGHSEPEENMKSAESAPKEKTVVNQLHDEVSRYGRNVAELQYIQRHLTEII